MFKKNVTYLLLSIFLIFTSITIQLDSKETMSGNVSKIAVKLEFKMNPAVRKTKNGKMVAVFSYDSRSAIRSQLKNAGFIIVRKKGGQYKYQITVTHRERARSTRTSRYAPASAPRILIDHLGFKLKDLQGNVMLDEHRGPFSTYANMKKVVKTFAKSLPEYIRKRLEVKDEIEYQIKILGEEGYSRSRIQRLGQLKDPRAIKIIKPFLRHCYPQYRWDARYALTDLGYSPQSPEERAAWVIVKLVSPSYIPARFSKEVWKGKKTARVIVNEYGFAAIKLFLQDLKCPVRKKYYAGDAISKNAKYAISGLNRMTSRKSRRWKSKRRKSQNKNNFDPEWPKYAVNELIKDISSNRQLDDKDRYRYLNDVIRILGTMADKQAIEAIKYYISDPKLTSAAKKAIYLIERRKK